MKKILLLLLIFFSYSAYAQHGWVYKGPDSIVKIWSGYRWIAIEASGGEITIDAVPTNGSANAVSSNGTYDELVLRAPLASPTLTGTPTAPTAAAATNTTQIATTAFVHAERTNTATLSNKTLSVPNITVNDNQFVMQDDGDATKKLLFQLSGITSGNTRAVTIPNKTGTMAYLDDIPLVVSSDASISVDYGTPGEIDLSVSTPTPGSIREYRGTATVTGIASNTVDYTITPSGRFVLFEIIATGRSGAYSIVRDYIIAVREDGLGAVNMIGEPATVYNGHSTELAGSSLALSIVSNAIRLTFANTDAVTVIWDYDIIAKHDN